MTRDQTIYPSRLNWKGSSDELLFIHKPYEIWKNEKCIYLVYDEHEESWSFISYNDNFGGGNMKYVIGSNKYDSLPKEVIMAINILITHEK